MFTDNTQLIETPNTYEMTIDLKIDMLQWIVSYGEFVFETPANMEFSGPWIDMKCKFISISAFDKKGTILGYEKFIIAQSYFLGKYICALVEPKGLHSNTIAHFLKDNNFKTVKAEYYADQLKTQSGKNEYAINIKIYVH